MRITLLTPQAGLVAAIAVIPLLAWFGRERRARHIRVALLLREPPRRTRGLIALALALVAGLLGLAATQPVLERTAMRLERADAEVVLVVDNSRSMLASSRPGAPTRFDRARNLTVEFTSAFPDVPAGLASVTDRVLLHLLPTTDERVFSTAIQEAIDVERPPAARFSQVATALGSLSAIPQTNFYRPTAKRRLLVVLTDGETQEVDASVPRAFLRQPPVKVLFVHVGDRDERIYVTGVAESGYVADRASRSRLEEIARLLDGRVFAERDTTELRAAAADELGSGSTRVRESSRERFALMPFLTLSALVPLAYLLWRRNV